MFKSATSRSVACCVAYLSIAALAATAASYKGVCGISDLQPPCAGFAFGVALYGALVICSLATFAVLGTVLLRRRISPLLKTSSVFFVTALLSIILPISGYSKLAGAVIVIAVFPISLLLLALAFLSVVVWAGRAGGQSSQ